MMTVHASGGPGMVSAAKAGAGDAKILAVTVLTSISDQTFQSVVDPNRTVSEAVAEWAAMACDSGADGIVCSPLETGLVEIGDKLIVNPGIRLASGGDDQSRTGTPQSASKAGASHLVVGRPIIRAEDPRKAVEAFLAAMA